MKQVVTKEYASRLLNCGMVILVTSAYKDKRTITPCAWHMPLSKSPAAVAVALAHQHFSSELIKKKGAFIINIPPWALLDKILIWGATTGRTIDKFKTTGLTPEPGHMVPMLPRISECIGWIECSLLDVKEVGDHALFFGEVLFVEAERDYFEKNYWNTKKVDLIFHLGARFFFKSSEYSEVT
jgi:flavin reductase (DIM6/NTAB) family NADH-FMN oxidoreductase RutF